MILLSFHKILVINSRECRLQEQATQLLEQVNLEIEEIIQKKSQVDYDEYSTNVNELESLNFFQNTLLRIIQQIGKLTFVFGDGKVSQESCFALFQTYTEQTSMLSKDLIEWQKNLIEKYAIEMDASRRKKQGIEGVVANITGVINDDWRYTKLDENLTIKINHQLNPEKIEHKSHEINLYQDNLQLLIKDGKTYLWLSEK